IEKNSDDDDLEILDVIPVSVKKTLPRFGPLKRKKLEIGSKVWIMGRNITSPFVEGMVISSVCDAERGTIYKVKFENEGSVKSVKICTAKELAYKENCDVIVPVGTRIVALYEKMMFAGVVAEHPTHTNRNRYLIFFDDNHAEYIEHKNIHVICGQSHDVADDVYENFSDFIRTYLNNYPEHALVKFQKNQHTRTEYNGQWERTIVLDIDGSLVKMYFIDKDMIQWIYRGCERFLI
ncbi:histone-lysine N-methyltransferase SETDB1, partial [Caerostris darwini]